VSQHDPIIVDTHSDPCLLTPDSKNLHEVKAVNGPVAFLDILAPPYDEQRKCDYYQVLKDEKITNAINNPMNALGDSLKCYLYRTSIPSSFFCQAVNYNGPDITDPEQNESV
jgi:cysteamine dioxygenase